MLNRTIRCSSGSEYHLEFEADTKHVQVFTKSLGLDGCSYISTPHIKRKEHEVIADSRSPVLDSVRTKQYRSLVMRGSYLSQDRSDIADML